MVAITMGFCAASGWTLHALHGNVYDQAVNSEKNLLSALAQDIARNIEIYSLSLQAVVDGLREPGLEDLSSRFQDLVLYDHAASARHLGSIVVVDRDGRIVRSSSREMVGLDVSDREYFKAQKAEPGRGLFISAPIQRRAGDHGDVIAFSRSIKAADGSFAGVVAGAMRLPYFQELFAKAEIGPHGSIDLLRSDGISLMRVPFAGDQVGRDYAGTAPFRRMSGRASGTFTAAAGVDGVMRIYSFTHIGDLPLVLHVAFAEQDVFADWWAKALTILIALAALCGTAAALALGLRRQLRRTALAEGARRRSEVQYRLLAEHAQDVIVRLDRSLRRTYVSPAIGPMLGYAPEEAVGGTLEELIHPDDRTRVEASIRELGPHRSNAEVVYRLRHKAGHHVWVEGNFSLVPEDGGFVLVTRDFTRRKEAEEQLEALNAELARVARSDTLTGLANRRAFDEALDCEWRRAARDRCPLSLLLIDVDRFKAYNDSYGHQQGDACLRAVAVAVAGTVRRPGDLVARYGGEELAVVLPDTDEAGARQVAERARVAVEALAILHTGNADCGGVVTVSVGCGIARPRSGDGSVASLITAADVRLYEAKGLGRNSCCPEMGSWSPTPPSGTTTAHGTIIDGVDGRTQDTDGFARVGASGRRGEAA